MKILQVSYISWQTNSQWKSNSHNSKAYALLYKELRCSYRITSSKVLYRHLIHVYLCTLLIHKFFKEVYYYILLLLHWCIHCIVFLYDDIAHHIYIYIYIYIYCFATCSYVWVLILQPIRHFMWQAISYVSSISCHNFCRVVEDVDLLKYSY